MCGLCIVSEFKVGRLYCSGRQGRKDYHSVADYDVSIGNIWSIIIMLLNNDFQGDNEDDSNTYRMCIVIFLINNDNGYEKEDTENDNMS